MDGLMIDSERYHQMAFDLVLREYDSSLSLEENNALYVGIGDEAAAKDLVKRKFLPISTEELLKKKSRHYREFLKNDIAPKEGLIRLLDYLRARKLKIGLASGSSLDEIKLVLTKLKLHNYYDYYCSSSQVRKRKPAPDVFLFASDKLNVYSSDCLVLEDAPSGLTAGKAAGMKVVIVPSRETQGSDFSSADYILPSLNYVPHIIDLLLS